MDVAHSSRSSSFIEILPEPGSLLIANCLRRDGTGMSKFSGVSPQQRSLSERCFEQWGRGDDDVVVVSSRLPRGRIGVRDILFFFYPAAKPDESLIYQIGRNILNK